MLRKKKDFYFEHIDNKELFMDVFVLVKKDLEYAICREDVNNDVYFGNHMVYICNRVKEHVFDLIFDSCGSFKVFDKHCEEFEEIRSRFLRFIHMNKPVDSGVPKDLLKFWNKDYSFNSKIDVYDTWFDVRNIAIFFECKNEEAYKHAILPILNFKLGWVDEMIFCLENHKK